MGISKLVLFGNDPKCSRCNKFKPEWNSKEFLAFAKQVGAEMVDAGMTKFPAVYAQWMKTAKTLKVKVVAFPDLLILGDDGKVLGHFTPSGTAKSVIDKIKALCPDCCDGDCDPNATVVCPTCKGTGKVPKK